MNARQTRFLVCGCVTTCAPWLGHIERVGVAVVVVEGEGGWGGCGGGGCGFAGLGLQVGVKPYKDPETPPEITLNDVHWIYWQALAGKSV